MFCDSEDLLLKNNNIAHEYTDAVDRMEDSCIDYTIKNYLNKSQNYKWENFEGVISHNHTYDTSRIGFNPFEFNLNPNEEKEEVLNIYYHTFDTTDNKSNKSLLKKEGQEYLLFKKIGNIPDDIPNLIKNNIRFKKRQPRYKNNDNVRR